MTDNQPNQITPKSVQIAKKMIWATILASITYNIFNWGCSFFQMSTVATISKEFLTPLAIIVLVLIFQIWALKEISKGDKSARLLFVFLFFMSLRSWLPTIVEDLEYSFYQSIFQIGLSIFQATAIAFLFTQKANIWFNEQHALKTKKA